MIILILFIFALVISLFCPLVTCIVFNMHNVVLYGFKDIYNYFKNKEWEHFKEYGIDVAIGYFGKGKSAYVARKVEKMYSRYGDKIRILSNMHFYNIPYTKLENFQQLIELQDVEDGREGTVVVIDEVSNLLSHRNFANFPLELLGILTQPRKNNIYILATAQRWFMIDKIFRSLVRYAIDLNKIWRFGTYYSYDAWDYETSLNPRMLRPMSRGAYFMKDKLFNSYDTYQKINADESSKFLSNEEALIRKGLGDRIGMENTVKNPTRRLRKQLSK